MAKDFIISINLLGKEIEELSYEKEGENLKIYIKPKYGRFSPADVNCETSQNPAENPGFLKLTGRLMARLQKISSPGSLTALGAGIFWSFIPEDDFVKTQTAPEIIGLAAERIKEYFEIPTLAVFWQESHSPTVIKGSIISENGNFLKKISQKISGELRNDKFSFNLGAKNPEEAIKSFFYSLKTDN